MAHLLDIERLNADTILQWIERALYFKHSRQFPKFNGKAMVNLFYENSTRTRVSFEWAAKRLGLDVIHWDSAASSEQKGETLEDTVQTLIAMGIEVFTLRHKEEGLILRLAEQFGQQAHFLNAGDGQRAHPSQALLDAMTILAHKPKLSELKIVVLGDIRHSRVANSFQCLCQTLQAGELVMVSPPIWQPKTLHYGRVTDDVDDALSDADVVMCLRVQNERLGTGEALDVQAYRKDFALTALRLKQAKKDVLVMHPGPMNRGVEIDSDVADGEHSVILEQVNNGVWMRMALIEALLQT